MSWKKVSHVEEEAHLKEIKDTDEYVVEIDKYERKKIEEYFFKKFIIDDDIDHKIISDDSLYHFCSKEDLRKMLFFDNSSILDNLDKSESSQHFISIIILKDSDDWFWITLIGYLFVAPNYYDMDVQDIFKCDQLRGLMEFLESSLFSNIANRYLQKI